MAREVVLGLVVKAKDAASTTVKTIGAGFGSLRSAINAVASGGKTAFASLGKALTSVNQGVELAKKGYQLLRETIGRAIESSLAQRAATDEQRMAWERYGREFERIIGLLGDILLPIILGIQDAFASASGGAEKFLEANKKLIGSRIVETLAKMATVLVSGIAIGAATAGRAWAGWMMIIDSTKAAANSAFALMFAGIKEMFTLSAKARKALGDRAGMREDIAAAKEALALQFEFENSSDNAIASAAKHARELDALIATIKEAEAAVKAGIGEAAVAAYRRLGQAIQKVAVNQKEIEDAAKREREAYQKETATIVAAARARADDIKRIRAETARVEQANAERVREYTEQVEAQKREAAGRTASFVVGVFQGAFAGVLDGTRTVGQAFVALFSNLAQLVAQNAAILLLATIFSGGVAGFGTFLGAGGSGVGSLIGALFGLNSGGMVYANAGVMVPGPPVDRDIIPAMLTPGERVLTVRETRNLEAGIPPRRMDGTSVGGSVNIGSPVLQTFALPSRAEYERWYRDVVVPVERRLKRNGVES